jgi:EAL domain-containing protein (putative c-di-GMP-specific phosphodiesterase class I)/CheY-like chemotaxis protein
LVVSKIRTALRTPFDLRGHEVAITASIGITLHPQDSADTDDLLRYADTAMYRAKQAGRDTFRFFTAQMNVEMQARLALETALLAAVENGEFVLHYQPMVVLHSGRVTGVEALLRWQRPGHGLVLPAEFIPVLEETGLIVRVGSWVIATVCRQIAEWAKGPVGAIQISANVSGRQFVEGDLEGDVVAALLDNGIAPHLLELELTESSLMANTQRTIAILASLRARGVRIAIDDFGTGYSSLAYLRRFPIDKLKIDIAFIRELTSNPDDAAIVVAIIRMAHNLKLDVVAEGVETAAQLAYLRRHLCDYIQGYYFHPPLAVAALERVLHEGQGLPMPGGGVAEPANTLLLVDDDSEMLDALQRTLQDDGYRILRARSAAEAFESLALHPVQVIVCDQRLPATGGATFLRRVRLMYPASVRIVLAGAADTASIIDVVNHAAVYRFHLKPCDVAALRADIRDAFRRYWRAPGAHERSAAAAPLATAASG